MKTTPNAPTLSYVVPFEWWQQFSHLNPSMQSQQKLVCPQRYQSNYFDSTLFNQKQLFIQELEGMTGLQFQKVTLNPKIKTQLKLKLLSPSFWNRIQEKSGLSSLITITDKIDSMCLSGELVRISVAFCCKDKSDAFIGFLPPETRVTEALRLIGSKMDYIEIQSSRIVYPSLSQKIYSYKEQQKIKLNQLYDPNIIAYNLEKIYSEDELLKRDNDFKLNDNAGTRDEGAIDAEHWIWVDGEKVLFRIKPVWNDKSKNQIQEMKLWANESLKGDMIQVPIFNSPVEQQLEKVIENLGIQESTND